MAEINEIKTYKNFYRNNKLYISKYKKISETNIQPKMSRSESAPSIKKPNNQHKISASQKDLSSFIKNPPI